MSLDEDFPNLLSEGYRRTSDPDPQYNCLAWAAGVTDEWWDPGGVWPNGVPCDDTVDTLVNLYRSKGFSLCDDGSLQPGLEKIAIYGLDGEYTHAALQLPDGKWTSKLGAEMDIEHPRAESVAGGLYGEVVHFMARRRQN